jgi:hypothetical protein
MEFRDRTSDVRRPAHASEAFGGEQLQPPISIDLTLRFWQSPAYETTVD